MARGGLRVRMKCVESLEALRDTLTTHTWDVLVTDHALPGFSSLEVLALKRELGLDIPCIVLSGAIGEEATVKVLKSGAADVLSKNNLARTPLAIERALREARLERERQRAYEELVESEARFRLMADAAPVLIWMSDSRERCTYFNQGWLAFTGSTLEEEFGDGWRHHVHPDDLPHALATYHTTAPQREPFRQEYRLRRHDGVYRWVLDEAVPRFEPDGTFVGYIGSCIDITDRKNAEAVLKRSHEELERLFAERAQALHESEERWRLLVENHPEPIMISVNTVVRYLNAAAVKAYGATAAEQVINKSLAEFIEPEHHPELLARRAAVASGETLKPWEHTTIGLDGKRRTIVSLSVPITFEGQPAAQTVFRDVTEQRRMEQYFYEAQRKLGEAKEHERLALARELHDGVLQQLLGLSMRAAGLKRHFKERPDALGDFEEIKHELVHAGRQLRSLVRDLRPVGLKELGLKQSLEAYLTTAQQEHDGTLTIEASLPEGEIDLPMQISVSLLRIVQEATRNALRHGKATQLNIKLITEESLVCLCIQDNGRGFQVPDSLTQLANEQHFGLFGMQEHVEMHQGALDIVSAPHEGTTVTVRLPLNVQTAALSPD